MQKKSRVISLSAMSAALASVFVLAGRLLPIFSLSAFMFAQIALTMPFVKDYALGGVLAFLAAVIISIILAAADFVFLLPFIVFFGLYPTINYFLQKAKLNKYIIFCLQAVWVIGAVFLVYFVTDLFISDRNVITQFINKYFFVTVPIFSVAFLFIYRWFVEKVERFLKFYMQKFKL